jgi:hypothetical protein
MAARLTPLLNVYRVGLFPIAKPTAIVLNWWLGPEGITFLRERDFRALITRYAGVAGADAGQLEAIGALNFLDLDDILVVDEGESVDPRSIITLPIDNGRHSRGMHGQGLRRGRRPSSGSAGRAANGRRASPERPRNESGI